MKRLLIYSTSLLILLSACAPSVIPSSTTEPPDINATIDAMAKTMVAETLTAIPTAIIHPTETFLPTQTPSAIPTITATATLTPLSFPWACDPDGRALAKMEFRNDSSQQVNAVLTSEICHREFTIDPGSSVSMSVPIYNYTYFGYIGLEGGFGGTVNLSDDIHTWVLVISETGALLETP